MNQQLNPGDLCIITNSIKAPANIGKTVTLVTRIAPGEVVTIGNRSFYCDIDRTTYQTWIIAGENLIACNRLGELGVTDMGMIREGWLMKLGDGKPLLTKVREKEHA